MSAKILVIVGKYKPVIEETLDKWGVLNKVNFVIQEIPEGTGHAVRCTLDHLIDDDGYNLILNGDCPNCTVLVLHKTHITILSQIC